MCGLRSDLEFNTVRSSSSVIGKVIVNPLPHMPNLGSSNSAANKSMMSKIWTNEVQLCD